MTDEPANDVDAASSPVTLGDNPENLEFGVGHSSDGDVVIKFNTMVLWFDMEPALAMAFAERIIDCAQAAQATRAVASGTAANGSKLFVPSPKRVLT